MCMCVCSEDAVAHFGRKLNHFLEAQEACGVVVGYPVHPIDGSRSSLCEEIEVLIATLASTLPAEVSTLFMLMHECNPTPFALLYCAVSQLGAVPCTLWDESYSTSEARRRLRSVRQSGGRPSAAADRDALAAASILEVSFVVDAS